MSDVTALFRFKNRSKHPDGSVSFLRAIDYTNTEYKELSKNLVLQVLNITGGGGGPYLVDFSNVCMFAAAVVTMPSGYVERRELAAYSETKSIYGVLENIGMASITLHLDLPDLSSVVSGTGVVGVTGDSFVRIYDADGHIANFTALGMPLVPGTPVSQKATEQTFAIVGAP